MPDNDPNGDALPPSEFPSSSNTVPVDTGEGTSQLGIRSRNAESNKEYRQRKKQKLELANQLERDGKPLPSDLGDILLKHEKEKERKRKAMAQKRKSEREMRGSAGGGSNSSIVMRNPEIRPPSEKTWIDEVLEKWDTHPIASISILHSCGLEILRKIASLPIPPQKAPVNDTLIKILGVPSRGVVSPNIRLVGNDLLDGNHHNVVDFITRDPEVNISGRDILFSMMTPLIRCDMNSPERRLYGALDIRFSNRGIKLCQYRAFPYDSDRRCLVEPNQWTITLTPAGAITHTHMDYYGRQQFFVHLFGEKIWLLWPPTKKNLDVYGKYHTQKTPVDLTSRCIDELEGLEVFYTKEEQAFMLRSNVLHACMSVSVCSHLGGWIWRLEEYKESFSMIDWGLDWLSGKASTDAPISDYEEEFRTIKSEISYWKRLLKENEDDEDSIEAKKLLKLLEKKTTDVKRLFDK